MAYDYCQANGHNFAAWAKLENARFTDAGTFHTIGGTVTCNVCLTERGVYDLYPGQWERDAIARYGICRRLARLFVGSKTFGREGKPMGHAMTLFALEAYGIDIPTTFDTGQVWGMPDVFYVRAAYDVLITVTRLSVEDVPGDVPGSWRLTADQLVRLPKADPRLTRPVGSVFTE